LNLFFALFFQIEDYSMVYFLPLNPHDEETITFILNQIDIAIQYGEDADVRTKDFGESEKHSDDEPLDD